MTEIIERREVPEAVFSGEYLAFLRKHHAGDANDVEFEHYVSVCKVRRLSPELGHIYWMKVNGKATIVLSITAYRLIAQRTGLYAGSDAGVFKFDSDGKPISCSVTVKKFVQGILCEFTGVALMFEHERDVKIWRQMPATMLEKCAEAKALRKAFPEELSGLYTEDELRGSPVTVNDDAQKTALPAFSLTNGRQVAWLHKKLQAEGVPVSQWSVIAAELDGLSESEIRDRFYAAVQRAKAGG